MPDTPAQVGPKSRGRVLVVDDARVVRAVVSGYLTAAHYSVDEAASGEAALKMLRKGEHDVVITDLHMSGLDGFEVLAAVKRLAPSVEVIILTGAETQDLGAAVRALRLGAHEYLTKPPAHPDEVVLAVERAMEKKQLRDANQRLMQQLEALSLPDALTGVPNRRSFDQALDREVARSRRHKYPLGFIMLDIDHFKRVNDTFGHEGGDEVLRAFAMAVSGSLRKGDSLYRYGGEEFAVVLPHADEQGVKVVAERIVAAVASSPVHLGSNVVPVTTSAGAASMDAAGDGGAALSRADAALYEAKNAGRNRACVRRVSPTNR